MSGFFAFIAGLPIRQVLVILAASLGMAMLASVEILVAIFFEPPEYEEGEA